MKDKYEISLWEDYLVPASGSEEQHNYVPAHYEERKLCVIGSDTMTASYRAYNPQLKSAINGTHTLTFKMYYTIKENEITVEDTTFTIDEWNNFIVNGHTSEEVRTPTYSTFNLEKTRNPFLNLLVNERKVKCFWKGEWYDFVIKNCQEDSSGKSITYTCTDLFINELSKNGFNIVLDTELENNSGTVLELADYILDGTDWSVDTEGSDVIQQKKEEPVYECTILANDGWTVTDQTAQTTPATTLTIPKDETVLVFYQQVQDILNYLQETSSLSVTREIQVAYAADYEKDTNSQLVTNAHCYTASVLWTKGQEQGVDCLTIGPTTTPYLRIFYEQTVSSNYRAERLVSQQVCKLDPLTGKYCYVWTATANGTGKWAGAFSTGDEIYEYRATEWNDALIVNNLVVNPKDFTTNEGWLGDSNLSFQLYPPYSSTADIASYTAKSYLHLSSGVDFYNAGVRQSSNFIPEGFSIGEKYIFRYKALKDGTGGPGEDYITTGIEPAICTYTDSGNIKIIDTEGPEYFDATLLGTSGDWVEWEMTCKKSVTRAEIYEKKVALFLKTTVTCWLEEAQLFREVYGASNTRINPGDINVQSVSSITYKYYNHTTSQGLLDPNDVEYLWSSTLDWDNSNFMARQYNEGFEKIRSISAKQSNRFNLIQNLAETYECWAQFIIEHDSTGRTIYENGVPKKTVRFKRDIGQETGIGFIYGIDLKTINRTIQSDKIVTKTIVSQNSNEFATNGFCTISRSKENYPRTNFLLNFDYYISQGLIDAGALNNDLYDSSGGIGYYYWLNKYNTEYDSITEILDAKHLELTKQLSYQTVYEGTITSLQENISNIKADLMNLANVSTWTAATGWIKANANQDQVRSKMIALKTQEENLATYQTMKANLDTSVSALQTTITNMETRQTELVNAIKELDLKFYKKYSRFIQEGSWIKEDYIDDNLYYLDAQSVAYTSAHPQIDYNISVIRISSIEEFKNKVFNLGDIAFIQDTDFFGYTYVNNIKTPYKEKVLISEVVSNFDQPEQDSFKVQNYKTQFEDLFQRITSTTQSLQYSTGEYSRAASIVEPSGTINPETLQNSISLNEQLVYSAQNEAIITDSTGITVSDTTNPNKKTKVTSGGIFITTDGGTSWKNAVRGEGIATQFLTAGSINVNNINIMDGNFKTFRWDESGINAYYKLNDDSGINLSKFVRFDHFGIYGIDTDASAGTNYEPESEDDIWDDAKFGMTWRGFFIKNKYENHSVEISSTDDIRIVKTPSEGDPFEVIKIGQIGTNTYGIRISDGAGAPVMETDNTGKLWLRKRLDISSTSGTSYNIGLGYLSEYKTVVDPDDPQVTHEIHEVFNSCGKFIVYEDGSVEATDIHATGGTIGNMTIDTANSIQDAVSSAKIRFNSEGISVINGGIAVYDNNGEAVFSFDTDDNALKIKGNGEFTGKITATEGSFTGTVTTNTLTANGGTIGGFTITDEGLYSQDNLIRLLSEGRIEAEYINLGTGAHIDRYLKLGDNAYIWNPDENINHNFIEVKNNDTNVVTLNDSGILNIGQITLDGVGSEIWGSSFSITPTLATFNNVSVSGKISTAVFEKGHIQSIGGLMMFKPSYKIENYNENVLTLDEELDDIGSGTRYVYVVNEQGAATTYTVSSFSGKTVTLTSSVIVGEDNQPVTLIDIGKADDLIIGVNSSDSSVGFLRPRGFTISEFKPDGSISNPKVFLGDLDKSGINFSDAGTSQKRGFGLYSESAYLTGSLTTVVGASASPKFAGVNTLDGVTAIKFDDDTSPIVFWAGSNGTAAQEIQNAPFQVTNKGSIYAAQGIFEGALITKSSIQGADIYAARIHGTGIDQEQDYGLAFYDSSNGIIFFRGDPDVSPLDIEEVFSIGTTGLKKENDYFIEINNSNVDFKGNSYRTKLNQNSSRYIYLCDDYISGAYVDGENGEKTDSKIVFKQNEIDFNTSNSQSMSITPSLVEMTTDNVKMDNTVLFGDKLKYEQVSNGYNLFVLS